MRFGVLLTTPRSAIHAAARMLLALEIYSENID